MVYSSRGKIYDTRHGEMAEWSKAPVLKTGGGLSRPRVQIPISPPYLRKALIY